MENFVVDFTGRWKTYSAWNSLTNMKTHLAKAFALFLMPIIIAILVLFHPFWIKSFIKLRLDSLVLISFQYFLFFIFFVIMGLLYCTISRILKILCGLWKSRTFDCWTANAWNLFSLSELNLPNPFQTRRTDYKTWTVHIRRRLISSNFFFFFLFIFYYIRHIARWQTVIGFSLYFSVIFILFLFDFYSNFYIFYYFLFDFYSNFLIFYLIFYFYFLFFIFLFFFICCYFLSL